MINEKYYLVNLFDFYGKLLTENQQEILDMYCNYDWSLKEIALKKEISRQAVYDSIKRSKEKLNEYEEKMKLVKKFREMRSSFEELKEVIDSVEPKIEKTTVKEEFEKIKTVVKKVIESY